ncbi:beta-propeller domain-containing protein, partial [Candidatus Woesearchaeota archaeon]|nr:beta-propeller domain-containing protein [Candidatus Woesearchaeota archaeon]
YYTYMLIYDISNRKKPVLARNITVSGNYYDSRMIGEYVYAVVNMPVYYYDKQPVPLPAIMENGKETKVTAGDIYYFDVLPDYSYNFATIMSVNIKDDGEDYNSKTYLSGATQITYVSQDNIYMTHTNYPEIIMRPDVFRPVRDVLPRQESTTINKIEISNGKTDYKGKATVPGTVLNQFSMDEYKGYFRIATTKGNIWGEGENAAKNNIYVLDEGMKLVGKVEDLAPGEKIYSARFMGERAYLVTFKKVDPLFVIDFQDPYNPQVLGKLKIPGYSDYLHPYDENHIIGIGKEAIEAEEGNFAWYQGIKLALFDVSDPENPKEISKFSIGDRGTNSEALSDHKAFLFDRKKNLLVMPILLAEIDKSRYAGGEVPLYAYGDFVWQGAYVFSLDTEKGFELKGRVSHVEDESLKKSGYYYKSLYSVKRSLYIGNVLYTVSDGMIKANDLGDMEEVNKVKMPDIGDGGEKELNI